MNNQLKTVALLGALSVLLVGMGVLVSPGALWIFAGIAVLMNLASYFYSDRIVLAMNRAHPVATGDAPDLHRMVSEIAHRADVPMPRVFVVDDDAPNAFATGRNPEHGVVAVTTGIVQLLSDRELRGVLAHEIAHIKNRDILIASIAAMAATIITFIASMARWGLIFGGVGGRSNDRGGNGIGLLLMAIVAPIAALIIQLAISRSREFQADEAGAGFTGDPDALADALLKLERGNRRKHFHALGESPATASLFICNPLSGQRMLSWFSTHPPMEERVGRLRALAAV